MLRNNILVKRSFIFKTIADTSVDKINKSITYSNAHNIALFFIIITLLVYSLDISEQLTEQNI